MSDEDRLELLSEVRDESVNAGPLGSSAVSTSAVSTGRFSTTTAIIGVATVAALLVWLATADSRGLSDEQVAPVSNAPSSTAVEVIEPESTAAESSAVDPVEADDGLVPWPLPPVDHRPHVLGRPGQPMVVDAELHRSVVYVNVRGRPTVIDLASGNQQEVQVADTRTEDTFAVEFGEVVSTTSTRKNLRRSQGREIVFTVHRHLYPNKFPGESDRGRFPSQRAPEFDSEFPMGPNLCLVVSGCDSIRWVEGSFGNSVDLARSMETDSEALQTLGQIFGSTEWIEGDGPFTLFTISEGTGQRQVRIPTPQSQTIVWLVEHQI